MQKPEFLLFLKLVESRENECVLTASNKALDSTKHPNYVNLAQSELSNAKRYRTCLEVIGEIKSNPNPYLVQITSKTSQQ